MAKSKKNRNQECGLDMTPMIDVVFQLIIFFVVTLKMTDNINEEIELEDGKNGQVIKEMPPTTLIVEVDAKGRISINNLGMDTSRLASIIKGRVSRMGNDFPLLIRADKRARHDMVRRVMDTCTQCGVWKLSFVAIQEHKAGE
ncbi:MAG: ExbD/TolR family protein [Kiritimatiellia bacterium]